MKLLIDHNLSPRLVQHLLANYPGSMHTMELGLGQAPDRWIWEYAATNGFSILTKDTDFQQLGILRGAPPKVIWVRVGNAPTQAVIELLMKYSDGIRDFLNDPEQAVLVLGP